MCQNIQIYLNLFFSTKIKIFRPKKIRSECAEIFLHTFRKIRKKKPEKKPQIRRTKKHIFSEAVLVTDGILSDTYGTVINFSRIIISDIKKSRMLII